ncbi:MAG: ATP-binding protein [Candidatus Saccharimonadales bacterium]
MNPQFFHQELQAQITTTLGENPEIPEVMRELLSRISNTYGQYDVNKKELEAKVKLRTDQLMSSTSRAYSFLDSLNMGFIMCDVSAEVVITNQAVKKILNHKSASKEEDKANDSNTEWTIDKIDQTMKPSINLKDMVIKSLETGQVLESKETDYGERVLHVFIAPMINLQPTGEKQKLGVVILVEDITEQKVLERSKDEFLSIASHELRTPLTAIRGNASLIKKYYGDKLPNSDTVEMIDDIHESAVRLIDIVNDFLDASSLEQGKMHMTPEVFLPSEVIGDVVHDLNAWAESKNVGLFIDPSLANTTSVTADKHRIKQVLYNLIGNAVKFTNEGTVTLAATQDQVKVNIRVIDTGKGVPAESQKMLFRKFQQAGANLLTRDNTNGTGLGLYISKLIIEQSGGRIKLESSEAGKGSTFVFSLPRTDANLAAQEPTQ